MSGKGIKLNRGNAAIQLKSKEKFEGFFFDLGIPNFTLRDSATGPY